PSPGCSGAFAGDSGRTIAPITAGNDASVRLDALASGLPLHSISPPPTPVVARPSARTSGSSKEARQQRSVFGKSVGGISTASSLSSPSTSVPGSLCTSPAGEICSLGLSVDEIAAGLVSKLTPANVADLVLLSMVVLPDKMPSAFQATYTPIAAAGTQAQIRHLARLLAAQLAFWVSAGQSRTQSRPEPNSTSAAMIASEREEAGTMLRQLVLGPAGPGGPVTAGDRRRKKMATASISGGGAGAGTAATGAGELGATGDVITSRKRVLVVDDRYC
ncbi:unnamed protein product, partial [Protopolystoma xenopodis]